jgi:hypothetical protein
MPFYFGSVSKSGSGLPKTIFVVGVFREAKKYAKNGKPPNAFFLFRHVSLRGLKVVPTN